MKEVIKMTTNEMLAKIRELKELKTMSAELDKEITALEDEIKQEMNATNKTEMFIDVFVIRYTPVTTNRFDTNKFKTEHNELYKTYLKQTTSKRFSIN